MDSDDVRIICKRCGVVVGVIKSGKQKDGTFLEPGCNVHVEECDACNPNLDTETNGIVILELEEKRRGLMGVDKSQKSLTALESSWANPLPMTSVQLHVNK